MAYKRDPDEAARRWPPEELNQPFGTVEPEQYYPYRTYKPEARRRLLSVHYQIDDCVHQLEQELVRRLAAKGAKLDNHHGFLVRTNPGGEWGERQTLVYYFSDWRFAIYTRDDLAEELGP